MPKEPRIVRARLSRVKGSLINKNITIYDRKTSVRLEPEMWCSLEEIAQRESSSVDDLCTIISMCKKPLSSLTSAIRIFIMYYYKAASTEIGHARANMAIYVRQRSAKGLFLL